MPEQKRGTYWNYVEIYRSQTAKECLVEEFILLLLYKLWNNYLIKEYKKE